MDQALEANRARPGVDSPVVVSVNGHANGNGKGHSAHHEDAAPAGAKLAVQVVSPATQAPATPAPIGARTAPGEPGMLFFGANRRSGTTWVTGILNAHPELSCRNEGWLLTHREGSADNWLDKKNVARWSQMNAPQGQYVRFLGDRGLERALHRGMMKEVVKQSVLAEGWKDYSKLKWMGDKTTTHYCTKVEFLHDTFPDARFIYMQRDGRDVVVSDMFLSFRTGDAGLEDKMSLEQIRHILRAREYHIEGKGPPMPLFSAETMRYFAGNWVECVSGGLKARELYKDQFFEVRYEQMVQDPHGLVTDLYRWLGVNDDEAFINETIDRCRFENFAEGRTRGVADPKAEWRKGVHCRIGHALDCVAPRGHGLVNAQFPDIVQVQRETLAIGKVD